MRVVLGCDSLV